jgi:hypothetical protein
MTTTSGPVARIDPKLGFLIVSGDDPRPDFRTVMLWTPDDYDLHNILHLLSYAVLKRESYDPRWRTLHYRLICMGDPNYAPVDKRSAELPQATVSTSTIASGANPTTHTSSATPLR